VFRDTACFPALERALPGAMPADVRWLLPQWGFAVEDRRLTAEELHAADDLFLTESAIGAVPALSVDHTTKLHSDSALCARINEAVFNGAALGKRIPATRRARAPLRASDGGQTNPGW
jgi:para-aminobenzoate synthetase component I